jgi:hypothetical protein
MKRCGQRWGFAAIVVVCDPSDPQPNLRKPSPRHSKAKIGKDLFQSSFMLITIQPFFFASSYSAWVKVPTFVAGSPCAGP